MLDLSLYPPLLNTTMQTNLLANVSIQQLKEAVTIREKMDGLEKELNRIVGGQSPTARNAAPRRKRRLSAAGRAKLSAMMKARWVNRRKGKSLRVAKGARPAAARMKSPSQRGQLKEQIIGSLKAAGKSGVTVKDLAADLGRSYGNISVWFHSTAKGVKEIRKVAPGRFAWAS